jgi:hypothetical protein
VLSEKKNSERSKKPYPPPPPLQVKWPVPKEKYANLHKSERMRNVFKELPFVSYNRNKNIKDILEHRKHSMQLYNRENGCKRCGENYTLCKHLIESSKCQDNEGKIYNSHGDINCKTTSVI